MSNFEAFIWIAVVYYIGEFISTKTKAWIPSVFITACLFVAGYWTFFPKDIVDIAGLGAPFGGLMVILMCITHMGTIISIEQLKSQWKIICVTLAGLAGMVIFCWFICIPLVGKDYVVAGLPPLAGGIVAATVMSQEALKRGLELASVLAIAMYSAQGFVGYPLTAIILKKEGKELLEKYRRGEIKVENKVEEKVEKTRKTLLPQMPDQYVTPAFIFIKLMLVASLSLKVAGLTNNKIHPAVLTLIFGIIATEIGFLEKNSLQRAHSQGFILYVLMIFVFSGLKDTTPEILLECVGPMIVIIAVGVIGLMAVSAIVGKLLGVNWKMAMASSLTALYGFPADYILTEESAKSLTEDPVERKFLMDSMLPQMIVGGFVTVTITSVIMAGIFVNFFTVK